LEVFAGNGGINLNREEFLKKYGIDMEYFDFFSESVINEVIKKIENISQISFAPAEKDIFKALSTPLSEAKIVIIGQDPYFQAGAATGLAFEVGNIISWSSPFKQRSLQNIVRNIYESYNGERKNFSKIREEIEKEQFKIAEPPKLFKKWQKQGVMLLNSYFTVKIENDSNTGTSHKKEWEEFFCNLIKYISSKNSSVTYFLWGAHAQSYKSYILSGTVEQSNHPSMAFGNSEKDFLNFKGFKNTKGIINWLG